MLKQFRTPFKPKNAIAISNIVNRLNTAITTEHPNGKKNNSNKQLTKQAEQLNLDMLNHLIPRQLST